MAELLEQTPETASPAKESAQKSDFSSDAVPRAPRKKMKNKKIVKRIVALAVVAALAAAGVFAWRHFFGGEGESEAEILPDYVVRGSITSVVEGSGAATPKSQAGVDLGTDGVVREVFVSEGDYVTEGTLLYTLENPKLDDEIESARTALAEQERRLAERQEELAKLLAKPTELDARADYAGMLTDVERLRPGDKVDEGRTKLATLVDNTRLLLPLYFSYAYENEIAVGQSATVSIPVVMAELPGTVYEIHKVHYISDEGSDFFEVVIALDNPGALKAEMAATATLAYGGETLYAYQGGTLEYFRQTELYAPLSGEVTWAELYNYARVTAGQAVAHVRAVDETRADEIKQLRERVEEAREQCDKAQEELDAAIKRLDSLNGFAPIDGTVLMVGIFEGQEVTANKTAVNIADTSTMTVNAMVDEMNVAYAKVGMPVNINVWGNQLFGVIESVSLTAQSENGVSRFPMVISVDNYDGSLLSNAYVQYTFTASQNDDCLLVQVQSVKYVQTMDGETQKVLFVRSDERPENAIDLMEEMADVPEGYWPVPVETGISDNYNVEILSGVEEGAEVFMSKIRSNMYGW